MFLPLQVTIYIISCHSFNIGLATKWSMHQWSAIHSYRPCFSSLLCWRLFDIELQCQPYCLFVIAHLNTWGHSFWKTKEWHKTGTAYDCNLQFNLYSIIVFQFLTLRLTTATKANILTPPLWLLITLCAKCKTVEKITDKLWRKVCHSHRWVKPTGEGWFLLNYKKVPLGTWDLKWNSQIVLQSVVTARHQPGLS